MATVNVYLTFNGQCEEAFNFYKSVFGGEFCYMGKFGDMPPQEGMPPLSEEDKKRVLHIGLPISAETFLFGCDNMQVNEKNTNFGNNFSITITPDSKEDADRFFNELSAGGQVWSPMEVMFWGDYFGAFTDKFGINWYVCYEPKQS